VAADHVIAAAADAAVAAAAPAAVLGFPQLPCAAADPAAAESGPWAPMDRIFFAAATSYASDNTFGRPPGLAPPWALEPLSRKLCTDPPPAFTQLAMALPPFAAPPLYFPPPAAQWQQHLQALLARDQSTPARRPESCLLPLPAHCRSGDAICGWGPDGAAAVLQRVVEMAGAEGRLRPEEAAAALGALAALLGGC
jgi:hypothetical protein